MAIKFLKYLVMLLAVVFLADRALFFCLRKIQASTYRGIQGGKINDYLRQPSAPNLLIMGPSNAAYQINPANFATDAYNIGHPNTEDAFQTALLSIIIQNKKIPKNILLHVNPYTYLGEDSLEDYVSKSPLKLGFYYSKNALLTDYINNISFKERVKFLMGLTQYNNKVVSLCKDFVGTELNGPYSKGFFPFPASPRDSINVTLDYQRVISDQKNDPLKTEVLQKSKMKYLAKFILLCKENKINLILFTLPFYPDVMQRVPDDLATENINTYSLANGLKYIDFRKTDLIQLVNKPSYWKDMQHLNEYGSSLESGFVSNTILPLLTK